MHHARELSSTAQAWGGGAVNMRKKSRTKSKNMAIDRRTRKNKAVGDTGTFERVLS